MSVSDPVAPGGAVEEEPARPGLPEDIGFALTAYPPAVARRAGHAVRALLEDRAASGAGAWHGSLLTGDGFPFEIAFCTGDDRLRFTVEPGAPTLDPTRRLHHAAEAVCRAGGAPVDPEPLGALGAMQADGGELRYGAWVGCRVTESGAAFKIYAEVPPGGALPPSAGEVPTLPDRAVTPRMLAWTPSTGELESYVRVESLEPRHLPALLAPAGLEGQSRWFVELVEDAYGHRVRGRLPGPSVGLSLTSGARPRVTLHFYARALWGTDARIRREFAHLAGRLGTVPRGYLTVTAPLASRRGWQCHQGVLGITPGPASGASLTLGLRPVLPDPTP